MSLFESIDDELTSELSKEFQAIFQSIRDLTTLLDVDSYAEMGDGHEHTNQLLRAEEEVAEQVRHSLETVLPEKPDKEIIATFLKAYRFEELYPDTVGPIEETLTTLELRTLPKFHARTLDEQIRKRSMEELYSHFSISSSRRARIENEFQQAKQKLEQRRRFVDVLRERFTTKEGKVIDPTLLKEQFDQWFPGNPLRESEVHVVLTRTCIYWCVPTTKEIEPRETEAELDAVKTWLKLTGRFAFQYFSHFPTFSSFDARDANPKLVSDLSNTTGLTESDVIQNLNSTTTIERTGEIEKYLIHDTWGHTWQGDLTKLGQLYDTMESLKSPPDASEHLKLPDGDVLSMLDLLYLNMRGRIQFDAERAERYMDEWIRLRLQALLAPIMAELTADCVEYKFSINNCRETEVLPSSSMFATNPAKLDFA